jgi:hypothetical protein
MQFLDQIGDILQLSMLNCPSRACVVQKFDDAADRRKFQYFHVP